MNVENLIKEEARHLKNSRRTIEIAPDISEKHINTIQKKYGATLRESIAKQILVMSYTGTGFFFLTGDTFYFDNFLQGGLQQVPFTEIKAIKAESGGVFKPDKIYLKTTNKEYVLDGCIDGINLSTISSVFNRIIEFTQNQTDVVFTTSNQGVLSSQLPEEIKLLYLQILCNYVYLNDEMIDANEYNAITKISVRVEINGDTRAILRKYMNDFSNRIKTGYLLSSLKKNTENQTGYWDAVKYCLMQDVLYIHTIQAPGRRWEEDGFIGSLKDYFALSHEQITTMEKAVSLNISMQSKDADMGKLKDSWEKFIKSIKDTSGYVPTLYLFCSGSIYGLKSYEGFFKKDETSQNAINKKRELILQEVISNNQKAVNILIGDMNYLADRLEKVLREEDEIQQNYSKIKLILNRIKSANGIVKQEEECVKLVSNS